MLGYTMRPVNCDPEVGKKPERCPLCKESHLRAGYCMMLDPLNPRYVKRYGETVSDETLTETLRKCVSCGKEFEPERATAKYCSSSCRLKAHRKK